MQNGAAITSQFSDHLFNIIQNLAPNKSASDRIAKKKNLDLATSAVTGSFPALSVKNSELNRPELLPPEVRLEVCKLIIFIFDKFMISQ